ncbi:MAG: hypothetical protein WBL80_08115 [Erysipelotrichaceae bacterium]
MKLTHAEFLTIQTWIYRNARPLDLARWKYQFEGASPEVVIEALSAYQNEDGGFGHALEPDAWNPHSSPLQTSTAIERIEEIGGLSYDHPLVVGILRYLFSERDFTDGRWANVITSNDDFPHAPWWNSASDSPERREYNPTAILVGFILKYALPDSILYKRGLKLAQELTSMHKQKALFDMHPLLNLDFLYDRLEEIGLDKEAWYEGARTKLNQDIKEVILTDLDHWNDYACLPTVFITAPSHPLYKPLQNETDKDLELKISHRNNDGIWDISWSWSDYPEAFAVAANWWKANLAIRNLLILKNFDLLEGR